VLSLWENKRTCQATCCPSFLPFATTIMFDERVRYFLLSGAFIFSYYMFCRYLFLHHNIMRANITAQNLVSMVSLFFTVNILLQPLFSRLSHSISPTVSPPARRVQSAASTSVAFCSPPFLVAFQSILGSCVRHSCRPWRSSCPNYGCYFRTSLPAFVAV